MSVERVPCMFGCGEPVDPRGQDTYVEYKGVAQRRSRGIHGLSLAQETGQYGHMNCFVRVSRNIPVTQTGMAL